jgi:hypothetical protein
MHLHEPCALSPHLFRVAPADHYLTRITPCAAWPSVLLAVLFSPEQRSEANNSRRSEDVEASPKGYVLFFRTQLLTLSGDSVQNQGASVTPLRDALHLLRFQQLSHRCV